MAATDPDDLPTADPDSASYAFGVVLAWRLLRGRRAAGLTQRDLADRLRVSRALVSAWEQGATLPPVHRIADVAAQLKLEIGALVGPAGPGSEPAAATMEEALVRAAQEELAQAAREGRAPTQPGAIVHALDGGARPRRGRPTGRPASAAPAEPPAGTHRPPPPAPRLASAEEDAATGTRAAEAVRLAGRQVRDRVRAALHAGELREHGWARRDLDRYWSILESARGALVSRAPLDARAARALAPMLDSLVTADIRSAADARARLTAWGSTATPGAAVPVRSYFARVTSLGDGFALACVDALAQARVADTAEDARVGLLLALLGSDVD